MPRAFLITNRRYFHVHGNGKDDKNTGITEKCDWTHESPINDSIKMPEIPPKSSETEVLTMKVQALKPENPSSPERDVYTAEGLESYIMPKPSSPQSSASLDFTEWPQQIITVQNAYVPILSQYLGIDMRIPDAYPTSNIRSAENHVCPECGKRYSTSSNLARHRQTHRSVTDKKARKCPHCDKVYVSTPAYSMHVRTHSQGCQCPYCGKAFSRPWLLQGHIRTHTGEKPFKCHICSKAFADKSNLRAHIQTHSTSKPYICQRCGKAFALKSYLYKHEESSCMRINRLNRHSDLSLK
ncbi:zinc finger protein SNAI2-like [Centruroides vittatus]|uniref:zinc finger protein SNAI2-like n=1 Tax=Centruroides vittatus TaxID=120091 RepID=UPI003510053E